jgi:hypothetical protein
MGTTSEAVIELFIRTYPKRRRFFVVEGAAGAKFFAGFFERNARTDELDDVGTSDDIVNETLGN